MASRRGNGSGHGERDSTADRVEHLLSLTQYRQPLPSASLDPRHPSHPSRHTVRTIQAPPKLAAAPFQEPDKGAIKPLDVIAREKALKQKKEARATRKQRKALGVKYDDDVVLQDTLAQTQQFSPRPPTASTPKRAGPRPASQQRNLVVGVSHDLDAGQPLDSTASLLSPHSLRKRYNDGKPSTLGPRVKAQPMDRPASSMALLRGATRPESHSTPYSPTVAQHMEFNQDGDAAETSGVSGDPPPSPLADQVEPHEHSSRKKSPRRRRRRPQTATSAVTSAGTGLAYARDLRADDPTVHATIVPVGEAAGEGQITQLDLLRETHRAPEGVIPRVHPPVHNQFESTHAATFANTPFCVGPSDRIGSFHSPTAIGLTQDELVRRAQSVDPSSGKLRASVARYVLSLHHLMQIPEHAHRVNPHYSGRMFDWDTEEAKSVARYEEYCNYGINENFIAEYNQDWIVNIIQTGVPLVERGSTSAQMLADMVEEVKSDYRMAVKKGIVDYLLLLCSERIRMNIIALPPPEAPYVFRDLFPVAPVYYHADVAMASAFMEKSYFGTEPIMVKLLDLWTRYEEGITFIVPDTDLSLLTPLELEDYVERQQKHLEGFLDGMDQWFAEVMKLCQEDHKKIEKEAIAAAKALEFELRNAGPPGQPRPATAGRPSTKNLDPATVRAAALQGMTSVISSRKVRADEEFVESPEDLLTDYRTRAFFDTIKSLLTIQMRGLIENSITEYVRMFEELTRGLPDLSRREMQLVGPRSAAITNTPQAAEEKKDQKQDAALAAQNLAEGSAPSGNNGSTGSSLLLRSSSTAKKPSPLSEAPLKMTQIEELDMFHRPLLKTRLTAEPGHNKSEYKPSFSELESQILELYDSAVVSLNRYDEVWKVLNKTNKGDSHKYTMNVARDGDLHVMDARRTLSLAVRKNAIPARQLQAMYKKYDYLLTNEGQQQVAKFLKVDHSLPEYHQEMARYHKLAAEIRQVTPDHVAINLVHISTVGLKEALAGRAEEFADAILRKVAADARDLSTQVNSGYDEIVARVTDKPTTSDAIVRLEKYIITQCPEEQKRLEKLIKQFTKIWNFLIQHEYQMSPEELFFSCATYHWPQKILKSLEQGGEYMVSEKNRAERALQKKTEEFIVQIAGWYQEVEAFPQGDFLTNLSAYADKVKEITDKLKGTAPVIQEINDEEELFGWEPTGFDQVQITLDELQPYSQLCTMALEWEEDSKLWMEGPFVKLDAEKIEEKVNKNWRACHKLQKHFDPESELIRGESSMYSFSMGPRAATDKLLEALTNFRNDLPIVRVLCNPGYRARHWEKITDVINLPLSSDSDMSLDTALRHNLNFHLEALTEISETASKEWGLEKALDKMETDWEPMSLEVLPHKDTGTFILGSNGVDEIQQMLDDHIVKTQTMHNSSFIEPFEDRVRAWEARLTKVRETIEVWLKVQASWLYLDPIFGSDDIMKQMPSEGMAFKTVNNTWREVMQQTQLDPIVLHATEQHRLFENLQMCNGKLDHIQAGLNQYLETKRLYFPRFFFLSNDELLEILAETKDPLRVQPHLKKCFEGIHRLEFRPNLDIVSLISSEKEVVNLSKAVNPKDAGAGAVERWLLEVEDAMRLSLQKIMAESYRQYGQPSTLRSEWTQAWPGQIVIAVSQIYWTMQVSQAIKQGTLKEYLATCNTQLSEIVDMVRGDLPPLARRTLGALVVISVRNRDIVQELVEEGVSSLGSFSWMAQLRYYFNEKTEKVEVKMTNSSMDYGYEYLGNSARLVITPLTVRCYRTLMGAMHLNLGGAPEGPAGTGKTETVKDLAKALARQCVVFNCSDGLDYLAMGKFFKGLASSGAWSCFDEFNRIDLEVLSVVAQQILSIQQAVAAGVDAFTFEGTHLSLNPTCNVFITMNPGYAGRSELPDNLKARFRPVAMMVPDYALIAEISLYSYGFIKARELAGPIVAVYRLCSELLSSQDHYDYGMRAVKSVLTAAGNLKRKASSKGQSEHQLLLRSIIDVNLPKFLSPDIALFEGILKDLFPGVNLPPPDYQELEAAIRRSLARHNLQPVPAFMTKITQLYETIVVRHGLMVVGLPFAGKTRCIHTLAEALTDLAKNGLMDEHKTTIKTINPKSVTMGQLYGNFDPVTHEWTDGVIANTFRACAADESPDRKWVVFDGPVDAIWIENMNTVLDDNKKLCLMSGEIIQMSPTMNLIFEVQDLAVASPATVSRCGMVYMEPDQLGWQPLVESWITTIPEVLKTDPEYTECLLNMFMWIVPPTLKFLRREISEQAPTVDSALVTGLMRILGILLQDITEVGQKEEEIDDMVTRIESLFLFALVWSLGCTGFTAGREDFDRFLRNLLSGKSGKQMKGLGSTGKSMSKAMLASSTSLTDIAMNSEPRKLRLPFPAKGLVYDYQYEYIEGEKGKWNLWQNQVDVDSVLEKWSEKTPFSDMIIPTIDTVRYTYLLDLLCTNGFPVLLVGPTGTGKSLYIKKYLEQLTTNGVYQSVEVTFSAQTTAQQTQDQIDLKLSKQERGVFGPPPGKKTVVFVDDLNMPALEVYGAQPPIELLRQLLDHSGWYETKEPGSHFKRIRDVQLVSAMGPPGGGRNPITPRFMRHFSVFALTDFDEDGLGAIFKPLLTWFFTQGDFDTTITSMAENLTVATNEIYKSAIKNLLPTPAKSHYMFNLRDFSRVIQGVLKARVDTINNARDIQLLWIHETMRVFYDRLVEQSEREWFLENLKTVSVQIFGSKFDIVMSSAFDEGEGPDEMFERVVDMVHGDFLPASGKAKNYIRNKSVNSLASHMNESLQEYNIQMAKPMNLVMFGFAIRHCTRILRVLSMPMGHMMLVGVSGSGRRSLVKLACFIADFELFTIEVSKGYGRVEWLDDMKKLMMVAGGDNKKTVFMLADTQINDESYLEDVNNLLNLGEVPNLFVGEERAQAIEKARPIAMELRQQGDGSPQALFNFFVSQCRQNLHVILTMSPIGDAFRRRLRMYPSLVNCMTIDWFQDWPSDALSSVALKYFADAGLESDNAPVMAELCKFFHKSATDLVEDFHKSTGRQTYITPTSYLELLDTFKSMLQSKTKQLIDTKGKYETGLTRLSGAANEVKVMQQELEDLKPKLETASAETEVIMKKIEAESVEVNAVRKNVQAEEVVVQKAADEATAIKDECEADLASVLPVLEAAMSALDTLTQADITVVKTMSNPPIGVKTVMEAVCVILQVKPERKPDGTGRFVEDYWPSSKKVVADLNFLDNLKAYDKDNIKPSIVARLRKDYMDNPDFIPEKVRNASSAAEGLCKWVRAMVKYDEVNKVVKPKRLKLKEAEGQYEEVMGRLEEKREQLHEVEFRLQTLQDSLDEKAGERAELERQVELCKTKITRAEKLISGLGGERTRWIAAAQAATESLKYVSGDVLLSSAIIAYLGPFTVAYRGRIVEQWIEETRKANIVLSDGFSLASILGTPVTIREWVLSGLPSDSFSADNAIMVTTARRWPLMIDPQGQANKWVKNMEKDNHLHTIKLNDPNLQRTLENAVQFGQPILIEDVPEVLDPTLEPLLEKQLFREGGVWCIKIGENAVEYSEQFRLYITTKLRNPHYLPEVSTKVTLVNFMITLIGLEDQLLGHVVAEEKPDLEAERSELVVRSANNRKQLTEIEAKILEVLSSSQGNILEDETAVEVLSSSKTLSDSIQNDQKVAEMAEKKIEHVRNGYKPVAERASVLFFAIADLASIESMYQYSLEWFVHLFVRSIRDSKKTLNLNQRIGILNEFCTHNLYINICRSLFEKDKLLFSFHLCMRILQADCLIDEGEWRFLLSGGAATAIGDGFASAQNPTEWLPQPNWVELQYLSQLPAFQGFMLDFQQHLPEYKNIYDSATPHRCPLPGAWDKDLSHFQKLLVLRCLRQDKILAAARDFVVGHMGEKFVEPPRFDLLRSYKDSSPSAPIVFLLSPGSDPMNEVLAFAESQGMTQDRLSILSLGQGQGPIAEKMLHRGLSKGDWVILQNCHLALSWMPTLDRLVYQINPEEAHPDFRLWLTSYPSDQFPVTILQNGVKITNESPKGLKNNLIRSYTSDPVSDTAFFEESLRPAEFKRLLYGLCFFHAIVQERREFGALGWNIPYEFNESDLRISVRQLRMFIDEAASVDGPVPFDALQYLIGQCNYGGRVTDSHDREALVSILSLYITPDIFRDDYPLSESGTFVVPPVGAYDSYMEYVGLIEANVDPEVFGMHSNADITKDLNAARSMFSFMQRVTASAAGGAGSGRGASVEDTINQLASNILAKLPANFNIEATMIKFPTRYAESMNTVLVQELIRYNRLLSVIRRTLEEIIKATKGLVTMSPELEAMGASLFEGSVPSMWAARSYPSMKPLGAYVTDLLKRCKFFHTWLDNGPPTVYWISGFFFTQSFLTGALQNFARKHQLPIDTVVLDFVVMNEGETQEKPGDGVYIRGLYLEGARWDYEKKLLAESHSKVLYTDAPTMWFKPCKREDVAQFQHYECPVYKTSERRGTLSTTGHSTNYVLSIRIPSDRDQGHWLRRGVACLCSLDT